MTKAANDNKAQLFTSLDFAVAGQAITITQAHRKFGRCYGEFVKHCGDGKHVMVRKLISGTWKARWTNPMKVERALISAVHTNMAQVA
jgi:hypothetical protein